MAEAWEKGNNPESYNFDKLIKEFKKKMEADNVLPEYKHRIFYEKPGVRKKRKREAARRRRMKKESKE